MRWNYGNVPPPTKEQWADAFNNAPACHHPAPSEHRAMKRVDPELIDEVEEALSGE